VKHNKEVHSGDFIAVKREGLKFTPWIAMVKSLNGSNVKVQWLEMVKQKKSKYMLSNGKISIYYNMLKMKTTFL
jgi:hypothetical protein